MTNHAENVEHLADLGIQATVYKYGLLDRLLTVLRRNPLAAWLVNRFRLLGPFERELQRRGTDLIYFVAPSATPEILQTINYIYTLYDLCHRDFPEFPEVRNFGIFQYREAVYRGCLAPAFLTLTESIQGADAAVRRYGIDRERILAMPLSPSPFISSPHSVSLDEVMSVNSLTPGYYFYPAQLWAHKNHIRILEATALLRQEGIVRQVVFAGGDQGLADHMKNRVAALQLEDQVRLLGFVPVEHMRGLYEGCAAVVMPTYFGPTNIPPLEAWSIGCPLIYSSHLSEQAGDAALLVDPDDAHSLANAMREVLDPAVAQRLVVSGRHRLVQIEEQRRDAEHALLQRLQTFERRQQCWGM
ncbi:MAG: glycosyltransferase family 1 protein [Methylophilaceae bacterium]|nr:MAG: glycosyltransferase family 1 protein [Methylophilaceae bacterium]